MTQAVSLSKHISESRSACLGVVVVFQQSIAESADLRLTVMQVHTVGEPLHSFYTQSARDFEFETMHIDIPQIIYNIITCIITLTV